MYSAWFYRSPLHFRPDSAPLQGDTHHRSVMLVVWHTVEMSVASSSKSTDSSDGLTLLGRSVVKILTSHCKSGSIPTVCSVASNGQEVKGEVALAARARVYKEPPSAVSSGCVEPVPGTTQ